MHFEKDRIGNRIKSIREAGHWNLEDFGELVLNASKGTVSNWENGVNIPSKKRLERIAKIGHKSVYWILYGTLKEYVLQLFSPMAEIEDSFIDDLLNRMLQRKVSYEENDAILKIALEIKPELRDDKDFKYILEILGTSVEQVSYYDIEENDHYRKAYLPMLSDLFKQEADVENESFRWNDQIMLRILDMLDRMNPQTKEKMNEVIKKISWLATNNIFRLERQHMNPRAIFGGISSESYEEQKERSIDEINYDLKELTAEIRTLLNEICMQNYDEFQKKEYKSIF